MSQNEEDQPLSYLLQFLVAAERRRPGYSRAEEARVWERIESSLDWIDSQPTAGAPSAIALHQPPARADSTRGSARRRRWLVAAAVLATLAAGAGAHAAYQAVARRWTRSAAGAPVVPQLPAPPAPAPPQAAPRQASPQPESRATTIARPSVPKVAVGGHAIARERELLEMARTALGLSRLHEARSALEQHRREFPKGQLIEERESLVVQLLLALGEIEQARASAVRFHARYPASIFWPSMAQQLDRADRHGE